jgi:hypothetical protein
MIMLEDDVLGILDSATPAASEMIAQVGSISANSKPTIATSSPRR